MLFLGIGIAVLRCCIELVSRIVFAASEPDPARPDPEPINSLWYRVRSDPSARTGALLLASLMLAVCYARPWFDFGHGPRGATPAATGHADRVRRGPAGSGGRGLAGLERGTAATVTVAIVVSGWNWRSYWPDSSRRSPSDWCHHADHSPPATVAPYPGSPRSPGSSPSQPRSWSSS
jgi:hypothetical protein